MSTPPTAPNSVGSLLELCCGDEAALGQRGHPRPHQHRRVRHRPDHRRPGRQFGLEVGDRDPGGDGDEHLLGAVALGCGGGPAQLPHHRLDVGRLHRDEHERRVVHRVGCRCHQHRIGVSQVLRAFGDAFGHHQVFHLTPRAKQTRQQSFADAATTDDRDSCHGRKHRRQRGRSRLPGRGHHRQLTRLRDEPAQAVNDDVVLVEPVVPDLQAGAHHPQPAVGGQAPQERGELRWWAPSRCAPPQRSPAPTDRRT